MRTARLVMLAVLLLSLSIVPAARAVDDGQTQPRFNHVALLSSNSAADIVALTNGAGNVKGFQCHYASGVSPLKVKVNFYLDGGSAQSATLDPFPTVVDSSGEELTAFIPMNLRFDTSIRIELQRLSSSGSGQAGCVVSWALD